MCRLQFSQSDSDTDSAQWHFLWLVFLYFAGEKVFNTNTSVPVKSLSCTVSLSVLSVVAMATQQATVASWKVEPS